MAEEFPCDELLAEFLCRLQSTHQWVSRFMGEQLVAHMSDFLQVLVCIHPQHLDGNLLSPMFAFPYVPEPTRIRRISRWYVA